MNTQTVKALHSRQGWGITRGEVYEMPSDRANKLIELGLVETVAKGTKSAPPTPSVSKVREAAPKRQPATPPADDNE
jgi:hypothetical protein